MTRTRRAPGVPYATGKTRSKLEARFLELWRDLAGRHPQPEVGYVFAPPRKWEVDFAWPDYMLIVEVHGGQWMRGGGRHQRGQGFQDDLDKENALTLRGWRLLRFTTSHFDNPQSMVDTVVSALKG